MIYFISDTHFGDDAIRRYENRPFENVAQMNEQMIQNWNHTVQEEDTIYILGDFCVCGQESCFLKRLQGRKVLVKGNHDTKTNEEYRALGFAEVYDLPVILQSFWILSHEPLYVNENMPYANLFGHVHNAPQYKTCSKQHYCVTVERIQYTPISFEAIKEALPAASRN
ncbi:MAG: metallophosphoesterase [Roseburia sp.]|nr:metallophosphoesterase [Roseburia sp.]